MEHGRTRPVIAFAVVLVSLLLTTAPAGAAAPEAWPGPGAAFAGMPRAEDPACDKTWDGTTGSWFEAGK